MKRKRVIKRTISMFLSLMMILTLFPSSVFAEGIASPTDSDGNTSVTTEEETTETVTEEVTTEEVTTEETTEETTSEDVSVDIQPTFNQLYDGVSTDGKDFTSCELLIATSDASIFTADTEVISEFNGIYLTRYADAEQTKSAYTYYYTKASLVEPNTSFKGADGESDNAEEEISEDDGDVPQQEEEVSETTDENSEEEEVLLEDIEIVNDGHGEADLSELNTGNDAFSNVNDLSAIGGADIALIDSGASGSNVVGAVSVLGGGTGDDNGHGTKMYNAIINQNPNARILSIKALDSSNRGQASDIYAAIQYAIDSNVRIINLSLASISSIDSQIVIDAINEALSRGIIVVGAAGNYGSDASFFVPGCIGGAIICTATDENGVLLSNSNFGSNVDYYVVANSTSEATAIVSGLISKDGTNFSSEIVRTEAVTEVEEVATENDATDTDAEETDAEETDTEERTISQFEKEQEKTLNQRELNEDIFEDNPWLQPNFFYGQAPAGYPQTLYADVFYTEELDHADSNGRIGSFTWNCSAAYNDFNINDYNVYLGSVYCQCVKSGLQFTPYHRYDAYNAEHVGGGNVPGHPDWHVCATPGSQTIPRVRFEYQGSNPDGSAYYQTIWQTSNSDGQVNGVQAIMIDLSLERKSLPGYVSLHKQATNPDGTPFTGTAPSMDGIVYSLYDDEHPDSNGNTKIADFTLGANGYPKAINITSARADSSVDKVITGDDGHLYLQWTSTTEQTWYFKEKTVNSNYIINNQNFTVQYAPSSTKNIVVNDAVANAYIRIKKEPAVTAHTGSGISLANAVFGVYPTQADANNNTNRITTLTTTGTGYTQSYDIFSKMGGNASKTFYIKELTASAGFHLNSSVQTITAQIGKTASDPVTVTIKEPVDLNIQLIKKSSNTSYTNNNPNYDLTGAEYKVFLDGNAARSAQSTKNYSAAIGTLTTDSNGVSNMLDVYRYMTVNASTQQFVPRSFFIIETKAPKNYRMSPTVYSADIKANSHGVVQVNVTDDPINDPVNITVKKEHQNDDGSDAVGLEGATFELNFYPLDINRIHTFEDLKTNYRPSITKTYTTTKYEQGGQTYVDVKIEETFPVGFITLEEKTPPTGFVIGDNDRATVNGEEVSAKMAFVTLPQGNATDGYTRAKAYYVDDEGNVQDYFASDATVFNEAIVPNSMGRADVKWIKLHDKTDDPVENAEFEIKNLDTGETVTVKTDKYGAFSTHSSYKKHTEEGGIWFKQSLQGAVEETPNDDKGALPLGKYLITETKAPAGMQKEEPFELELTEEKTYTVYDNGRADGKEVISDMDEVGLGTVALVETSDGEQKTLPAAPNQTIHDKCAYTNLRYNTSYTLIGKLMEIDKDGNCTPFMVSDEEGNEVEATGITHFTTPDTYTYSRYDSCGEETVEFANLDFTGKEGYSYVVFERLYLGNVTEEDVEEDNIEHNYPNSNNETKFPIIHENEEDKDQTVTVPNGETQALSEDGTKTISSLTKHITINDTVNYTALVPGREYRVEGQLYIRPNDDDDDKEYTEEELEELKVKDVNGEYVTGSTTFVAEEENGSVVVTFDFDVDYEIEERTYVVFEECFDTGDNDVRVFLHADIHDDKQSPYTPVISTQAKGTEDRSELCYNAGKFRDEILYKNLDANTTYTVTGLAYDKETEEPILLNGKKVTAQAQFTTGDSNKPNGAVDGSYELEFEITEDQFKDIEGKTMVIFEVLQNEAGTVIAKHEDINDKFQELTIPKIITTLKDTKTGTHIAFPDEETTLKDEVVYHNLIPSKSYVMRGTLMKKSGEPLLDENGKEITASKEFVADESGSGVVEIVFTFNAKILKLEGESTIAFESCSPSDSEIPVGFHADITDKEQTVDFPKAGTKVSKSDWTTKDTISLTDSVSYTNLIVEEGYKYKVVGWLVDSNGNKITVDGKEVKKEVEFTPKARDGMIDVKFDDFSAAGLEGKYVVFEEIYIITPEKTDENGKKITSVTEKIAQHKDLTDTNQTINVTRTKTPPKTGMLMFFILLGFILAGGIGIIVFRKKRFN